MIVRNSKLARLLGVNGIVLYPFIFLAPENPHEILLNHEAIHWFQMKRDGVLKFYYRYLKEYYVHRWNGLNHHQAYLSISYEQEAYAHDHDLNYLVSVRTKLGNKLG